MSHVRWILIITALSWAAPSTATDSPTSGLTIEPASPVAPHEAQDAFTYASFTYQGRIRMGGQPLNGACDLRFELRDAAVGGGVWGFDEFLNVQVVDGLFTVLLNSGGSYGPNPFPGAGRWLETSVRFPAGSGSYTILSPRQAITPEPWALSLRPGAFIKGSNQIVLTSWTTNGGGNAAGIMGLTGPTGSAIFPGGQTGVWGDATGQNAIGVFGSSQEHYGVMGKSAIGKAGVVGQVGNIFSGLNTNERAGVWGLSDATAGFGVLGDGFNGAAGVRGRANGNTGVGVRAESFGGSIFSVGLQATAHNGGTGLIGESDATTGSWAGVYGQAISPGGTGVQGYASHASGVNAGVNGQSTSLNGYGGSFTNTSSDGIALYASGSGSSKTKATLRVINTEPSCGIAAYITNNSTCATAHFLNQGQGQVLWLQNGGDINGLNAGDFITCQDFGENDAQCRIMSSGEVRSDVGFNTPAADFAEMMPAREALEPGEVLAMGADGRLERATEAYQANVVGVRSTKPGFTGGFPVNGEVGDRVPLAVVGIVPVKASAEGGPIRVGDLLVSSGTPGHCMRGEGMERCFGRTIGKALDALPNGQGTIRALVFQR